MSKFMAEFNQEGLLRCACNGRTGIVDEIPSFAENDRGDCHVATLLAMTGINGIASILSQ
jgi:hypothetical protein